MDRKAIYIFSNSLSEHLKIGISSTPMKRAKAISGYTSIKMKLEYTTNLISNAREIEKRVHKDLKDFNVSGEWFKVDLETAKKAIEKYKNEFIDLEEIKAPHETIKQKTLKQVYKLPEKYKRIDDYVVKASNTYYISYNFLDVDILLSVPYLEQVEEIKTKLKVAMNKIL